MYDNIQENFKYLIEVPPEFNRRRCYSVLPANLKSKAVRCNQED